MKKYSLKVPAKLNFTLDVLGVEGKFHNIESLVASVNVFDAITLLKRKDGKITVTMRGLPVDCDLLDNNAYKAAKLFKEKFSTSGVDIIIDKNIPVGGGMGGSSADIAGTLLGMKTLFEKDVDLIPLASELGSDAAYMLDGGWAIISGRGEKVKKEKIENKFYLLIITEEKSISARQCYKKFDELGFSYKPCTASAIKSLKSGDVDKFLTLIKNDLMKASCEYVENVDFNVKALLRGGAKAAIMTGSGSATFGVYKTQEERDASYKKLKPLFEDKLLKAETI